MTTRADINADVAPLLALLAAVRRHAVMVWMASLALGSVGAAGLALLVALWLDHWLVLPGAARLVLLLLIAAIPVLVIHTLWKRRPGDSPEELALLIERRYPDLDNQVINSLQLAQRGDEESRPLIAAIALDARKAIGALQPTAAVPKRVLMMALAAAGVAFAVLLTLAAVNARELSTGLQRVLVPLADNTLTRILEVTPGNLDVLAHSDVEVTASLGGRIPTQAELVCTSADRKKWTLPMTAASASRPDRLTAKLERIDQDTAYRVVAGDDRSASFDLRVHQKPAVRKITQTITPPAYLGGKPSEKVGGAVEAVAGSRVDLLLDSTEPVKEVRFTLCSKRAIDPVINAPVPGGPRGSTVVAKLNVDRPDRYNVVLVSPHGFESEPIGYDIIPLEDRPPQVSITRPNGDQVVTIDAQVQVEIQATDDHALQDVRIARVPTPSTGYEPASPAGTTSTPVVKPTTTELGKWPLDPPGQARLTKTVTIAVADLGLTDANPVTVQAFARDFRPGSDVGSSAPVTFRLRKVEAVATKAKEAFGRISLDSLIQKQRANIAHCKAILRGESPDTAEKDPAKAFASGMAKALTRQEEIRGDALALSKPDGVAASNPALQKRLGDMVETLLAVAIEQVRSAGAARGDYRKPLAVAIATQEEVLRALVGADARQDADLADRVQRQIAEQLADLIAKEKTLRGESGGGAAAGSTGAPATGATPQGLSSRHAALARDAGRLQALLKSEGSTGAGGNPQMAEQYTRMAEAFDTRAVRANMLVAAEKLSADAKAEAAPIQDKVIHDLAAIQKMLRESAMAEAKDELKETTGGLDEAKKKLDRLTQLQQSITETARQLQKTEDLRAKDGPEAAKVDDIKEARKNVGDAVEQLVKDMHALPAMSASNDLIPEMSEVFEKVKQAAGSENDPVAEVAVTRDEGLLAALKAMQKKMGERMGDLEMWQSDRPDSVKWKMENFDKKELGKIPLGDLPDALEDIVGNLLKQADKLKKEAQDSASNQAIPDGVMGWDIADGPMPSWAAKGKSGNTAPNDNEQTGRSGSGRQGKSSGEIVGDTVKGLKGAEVEARRTNDGFQSGELKEEDGSVMDVKATGGGKLAGVSSGEGMQGDAPPRDELRYRGMQRQVNELKRDAHTVYSKARLLRLPTGELDRALLELDAASQRLRGRDADGFAKSQQQVVRALQQTAARLAGKEMTEGPGGGSRSAADSAGATGEPVPRQYEDAVAEYMRRIARDGQSGGQERQ
ncbi:MAG: hypothetical protein NTW19_02370 [Planctomycetota bacterium]|nr:hypothetical protein [Planctomycetota bacterium]